MASKKIKDLTPAELSSAPDDIVIAWNFIRIREALGLTQQQAADLGETTVGYIGKIEIAAVSFGNRAQQKWAKLFKVGRTEFLKRPDVGIGVIGVVMGKGVIMKHSAEDMEYVPSLPGHPSDNVVCLKIGADALYPHLRKGSCLYAMPVPVSTIRDDDLVIYAEKGEPGSIKEVELLGDGRLMLKGLGRGSTVTKDSSQLSTVQKIVFVGM